MKISASVTVRNFLIATYFNLIIIQSGKIQDTRVIIIIIASFIRGNFPGVIPL